MQVVTTLRMKRTLFNLSQRELGEMVGVSQGYIGYLENMKATPGLATSRKLEEVFNLPINELLSVAKLEGGAYEVQ